MYQMIVIGAGPAGISMAVESIIAGAAKDDILIIERSPEHSFSIRKFYPDKKLVTANYKGFEAVCTGTLCIPDLTKQETITYLDKAISEYSIPVNYNETVWKITRHDEEQKFTIYTDKAEYETRLIAIAIGILGKPNKPEYKLPATIKDKLLFDITSTEIKNSKVLVVGGGDSASEYCQYLVQENNDVTLSYRNSEFKRMNEINRKSIITLAERGTVKIVYNSKIEEVFDSNGKPLVKFSEIDIPDMQFDFIVYALGGTTPSNFLKMIGIEFNGDNPVIADGHETNVEGLFLVGDLSAGIKGGSIIWAFNSTNTAIQHINRKFMTI